MRTDPRYDMRFVDWVRPLQGAQADMDLNYTLMLIIPFSKVSRCPYERLMMTLIAKLFEPRHKKINNVVARRLRSA